MYPCWSKGRRGCYWEGSRIDTEQNVTEFLLWVSSLEGIWRSCPLALRQDNIYINYSWQMFVKPFLQTFQCCVFAFPWQSVLFLNHLYNTHKKKDSGSTNPTLIWLGMFLSSEFSQNSTYFEVHFSEPGTAFSCVPKTCFHLSPRSSLLAPDCLRQIAYVF